MEIADASDRVAAPTEEDERDIVDQCPLFMTKLPEDPMADPNLAPIYQVIYGDSTKEERAVNFKEQGNEALKQGKKYYHDALMCYDRALEEDSSDETVNAVIHSNKAQVHLLLGNYGYAVKDCEVSKKKDPTNVKTYYRAARALVALEKYEEAVKWCEEGLEVETDTDKTQLQKLHEAAKSKLKVSQEKQKELDEAQHALNVALIKAGVRPGCLLFHNLDVHLHLIRLSQEGVLQLPVVLLYEEHHQSDTIECFREYDTIGDHLDVVLGETPPWDTAKQYTPGSVELYFLTGASKPVDPKHRVKDSRRKWVQLKQTSALQSMLRHPDYIMPGIPVLSVLLKNSPFKSEFLKTIPDMVEDSST